MDSRRGLEKSSDARSLEQSRAEQSRACVQNRVSSRRVALVRQFQESAVEVGERMPCFRIRCDGWVERAAAAARSCPVWAGERERKRTCSR